MSTVNLVKWIQIKMFFNQIFLNEMAPNEVTLLFSFNSNYSKKKTFSNWVPPTENGFKIWKRNKTLLQILRTKKTEITLKYLLWLDQAINLVIEEKNENRTRHRYVVLFILFLDWCAISWFIRAFNRKDLAVSLSTTQSDKDVDSSIRSNRISNTTPYKIDAMDCCRIFCLFSPFVSVLCWFMWAYFDPIFTRPTKSELAKYIYT